MVGLVAIEVPIETKRYLESKCLIENAILRLEIALLYCTSQRCLLLFEQELPLVDAVEHDNYDG